MMWRKPRGFYILMCKSFKKKDTLRHLSLTSSSEITKGAVATKIAGWMKHYEDLIGLTEVKEAQNRVISAEKKFLETQELRRDRQVQLQQLQVRLKEIHSELDKTLRGDDKYLQLVTQEHTLIKDDRRLSDEFQFFEKSERDYFSSLSNALRDSHERERSYAEKTKYWSIIGSVVGAVIGILGTSINNHVRLRELRNLVQDSVTASSVSTPVLQDLVTKTTDQLKKQQDTVSQTLRDVKDVLSTGSVLLNASNKQQSLTNPFSKEILNELADIKALITAHQLAKSHAGESREGPQLDAVVYLGRDIEEIMKDTQRNLEWKIKINSLATVAMIYGGIAIALPVLYKIFGG